MHLTIEALARLVDEPAAPEEAAHLRDCLVCRRELAGLREQTEALAALGGAPPAHGWDDLRTRLEEERLIRPTARRAALGLWRPQARAAAAAVLFLAGGAAGALFAPGRTAAPIPAAERGAAAAALPAVEPEIRYVDAPAPPLPAANGARLVSSAEAPAGTARSYGALRADPAPVPARAREADRAARELLEAQAAFVAALQRLAAAADPASGNDPATRLAALERLVGLTAAALERAPGDPVINGYHLAAAAERDALRREIERDARAEWF